MSAPVAPTSQQVDSTTREPVTCLSQAAALNKAGMDVELLEPNPGSYQLLDAPVILLDNVIQDLHLPDFGKEAEFSILPHGFRHKWVSGVPIDRVMTLYQRHE